MSHGTDWWGVCTRIPFYYRTNLTYTTSQKHARMYPTLVRIALDVCPVPASSVPCERLFSGGGETATDNRARLGAERFEQVQVMKHVWRNSIVDFAATNSDIFEDVFLEDFHELYRIDNKLAEWDILENETIDC
jgi:hAT family C-terminal dimerisation region